MNFYILTINFTKPFHEKVLVGRLNKSLDWIQIMPGVFIIKSNSDIKTWYDRLSTALNKNQFFIVEIDLSVRNGWLPKSAWDWIKEA
ncbi:MAG: hypothetical protein SH817_10340 [Leptospira sp.]|nr:hypothetical protein [Leptospira sp.]